MVDLQTLQSAEWEKVKSRVDGITQSVFQQYVKDHIHRAQNRTVSHETKGKKVHNCILSSVVFDQKEGEWEVTLYWVSCAKCGGEPRREYVIGWNNTQGVAYENTLVDPEESRY